MVGGLPNLNIITDAPRNETSEQLKSQNIPIRQLSESFSPSFLVAGKIEVVKISKVVEIWQKIMGV